MTPEGAAPLMVAALMRHARGDLGLGDGSGYPPGQAGADALRCRVMALAEDGRDSFPATSSWPAAVDAAVRLGYLTADLLEQWDVEEWRRHGAG